MNSQIIVGDLNMIYSLLKMSKSTSYNSHDWSTNKLNIYQKSSCYACDYCLHNLFQTFEQLEIEKIAVLTDLNNINLPECNGFQTQPLLNRYLQFLSNKVYINDLISKQSCLRRWISDKIQLLFVKLKFQKLFASKILENGDQIHQVFYLLFEDTI
jgi:hypothetical protein